MEKPTNGLASSPASREGSNSVFKSIGGDAATYPIDLETQ